MSINVMIEVQQNGMPAAIPVPPLCLDLSNSIQDQEGEIISHIMNAGVTKLPKLLETYSLFVVRGKSKAQFTPEMTLEGLGIARTSDARILLVEISVLRKPSIDFMHVPAPPIHEKRPPKRKRSILKIASDADSFRAGLMISPTSSACSGKKVAMKTVDEIISQIKPKKTGFRDVDKMEDVGRSGHHRRESSEVLADRLDGILKPEESKMDSLDEMPDIELGEADAMAVETDVHDEDHAMKPASPQVFELLVSLELQQLGVPVPIPVPSLKLDANIPLLELEKEISSHIVYTKVSKLPILFENFDLFKISSVGAQPEKLPYNSSLSKVGFKKNMKLLFREKQHIAQHDDFFSIASPTIVEHIKKPKRRSSLRVGGDLRSPTKKLSVRYDRIIGDLRNALPDHGHDGKDHPDERDGRRVNISVSKNDKLDGIGGRRPKKRVSLFVEPTTSSEGWSPVDRASKSLRKKEQHHLDQDLANLSSPATSKNNEFVTLELRQRGRDSALPVPLIKLPTDIPLMELEGDVIRHMMQTKVSRLPILFDNYDTYLVAESGSLLSQDPVSMSKTLQQIGYKRNLKLLFVQKTGTGRRTSREFMTASVPIVIENKPRQKRRSILKINTGFNSPLMTPKGRRHVGMSLFDEVITEVKTDVSQSSLEITPAESCLGAFVKNKTGGLPSPKVVQEIKNALFKHKVLIFRDCLMSEGDLVKFTEQFGEPIGKYPRPGAAQGMCPEIRVVSNKLGKEGLGSGELPWQSDLSYRKHPAAISFLNALKIPESSSPSGVLPLRGVPDGSASTWFCNCAVAYEALDEPTKQKLNGLKAQFKHAEAHRNADTEQPVIHPVVRKHPVTGELSIYCEPARTRRILHLLTNESEQLISQLVSHTTEARFLYKHHWRVGDLLLYDNRCTMHYRPAVDSSEARVLIRTLIRCDQPP